MFPAGDHIRQVRHDGDAKEQNSMAGATTRPTGRESGTSDGARHRIPTYPAPKQLATTTDLKAEEVRAVTEAVNPLVADAFALYTKTKNFHWHMSGSHFRDYHLLLDEQADQIFDSIDVLAERVRRIGGTTIRSITHISQLQTIDDDNDDFVAPGEMMRRLLRDHERIAQQQRAAIEVCDRNRDSVTANALQEILDLTERRKWFLYEVVQGAENTN
jgi:starvation-inducible DNA-binding protein